MICVPNATLTWNLVTSKRWSRYGDRGSPLERVKERKNKPRIFGPLLCGRVACPITTPSVNTFGKG